jgi:hypothetical protein
LAAISITLFNDHEDPVVRDPLGRREARGPGYPVASCASTAKTSSSCVFGVYTATMLMRSIWVRGPARHLEEPSDHDYLLRQNVGQRADDTLLIASWIDPDAATWLRERSRVHSLLAAKP